MICVAHTALQLYGILILQEQKRRAEDVKKAVIEAERLKKKVIKKGEFFNFSIMIKSVIDFNFLVGDAITSYT